MIYAFVYKVTLQRAGVIILFILFVLWIQENKKDINKKLKVISSTAVIILLSFNLLNSVDLILDEIKNLYSGSKNTAQYINENLEEDSIFICTDSALCSAIIPYSNKGKFWDPKKEDYFSYIKWDENYSKSFSSDDLLEDYKKLNENNENVYLIYTYNMDEEAWNDFINENNFEEIYISPDSQNENYIIYKLK